MFELKRVNHALDEVLKTVGTLQLQHPGSNEFDVYKTGLAAQLQALSKALSEALGTKQILKNEQVRKELIRRQDAITRALGTGTLHAGTLKAWKDL